MIKPLGVLVVVMWYAALCGTAARADEPRAIEIPTGQTITPEAAKGGIFQALNPGHASAPDLRAGQAAAISVSPDGEILAILTSGFNRYFGPDGRVAPDDKLYPPELSSEYVFLFDISNHVPRQLQVLALPNTYQGLAWAPTSPRLFASGGKDDAVLEFVRSGTTFVPGRTFPLAHAAGLGLNTKPMAGGMAVSPDGRQLLVANLENDSVSLVDLASGQVVAEQDLRPGIIDPGLRGQPGGSFPRSVAWISADRAYVASERDREIISLAVTGTQIRVARRMPVSGQPVALLANRAGSRLYVTLDTTGRVSMFDTAHDALIEDVDVTAPASLYSNTQKLGGANSNALVLTPDERTLLVSNGGQNSVAVVRLSDRARGLAAKLGEIPDRDDKDEDDRPGGVERSAVIGLVPTGWYPTGVATSKDGATWYIVNGKSETGPNVRWCQKLDPATQTCIAENPPGYRHNAANGLLNLVTRNQFIWQLEKAGFLTLPAPPPMELARLTRQVARNNHFDCPADSLKDKRLFSFLHSHIHHVIYIIKENRSYDQVLGDLEVGNGDPRLTLFPERNAPNHHALARQFVTLDNFLVSGEVSWTGWDWAVSGQTNDFRERQEPLTMARRGLEGEDTGLNRNINLGYPTSEERHAEREISPADPDILPGERDVLSPDGPGGEEGKGHLWDVALRRSLTLRNWGFFGENRADHVPDAPLVRTPYTQKLQVFFPTKSALAPYSDPYYLDFSPAYPDYWRVQEWRREFAGFAAKRTAPDLMLVRLGNDHFGSFDRAIDGVNTPETQMADNDYALGLIVETVAHSTFANDTLIVSIEDDACDGPDHMDAHRSIALFAGPYVRQHALVTNRYTTVSILRTIEEILGIQPIGLNDALAAPMSELFDPTVKEWSYKAIVPDVLRSTQLPLPPATAACNVVPVHSSAYWTQVMAGQDFSGADRIEPVAFNQALWRGLKGGQPYPDVATGADLRAYRTQLLTQGRSTGDGCR